MSDNNENDIDAGWDDIDAGWDAPPEPKPAPRELKSSESMPQSMPQPTPQEDEDEAASFVEDDVTANRIYDAAMLDEIKRDDAVVIIKPLTEADEADEQQDLDKHPKIRSDRSAEPMEENETARQIQAISEETERLLLEQARAKKGQDDPTSRSAVPAAKPVEPVPPMGPSGQVFEVPSPLKASGSSGPAVVQPPPQVSTPRAVNLSLIVFIALLVVALGAVGAVILAAFF